MQAAAVAGPAGLQRPLARPRFTAGRSPIGQLEELGLSECLESLRSAGGETEAQEDAGGCQTPPAARVQSTRRPGPPGRGSTLFPPRRISLGSFGNPPISFPFPEWTMALCTSFPPNNSPLHSGWWGLRGRGTQDTHQGHCGRNFVSRPKGKAHAGG